MPTHRRWRSLLWQNILSRPAVWLFRGRTFNFIFFLFFKQVFIRILRTWPRCLYFWFGFIEQTSAFNNWIINVMKIKMYCLHRIILSFWAVFVLSSVFESFHISLLILLEPFAQLSCFQSLYTSLVFL